MKFILIISVLLFFSCENTEQNQYLAQGGNMLLQQSIENSYTRRAVKYYSNGKQKQFIEEYKHGSKNGWYKSWHKNGKIKSIGKYSKNRRIGIWKWFLNNGKCEYKYQYRV